LSARELQALGDDLLAGTFNGPAANHVASGSEAVITHAFDIVGEIVGSLGSLRGRQSQFFTGGDHLFDLPIPEGLFVFFEPKGALS
jgi:hypothetical protein